MTRHRAGRRAAHRNPPRSAYHRAVGTIFAPRQARRGVSASAGRPSVAFERLPEIDGLAPLDIAEAFRDLPGLALLESARPGRTGRWSFLTADPLAVLEQPAPGPDPFAGARSLLRRLDGSAARGPSPFFGGLVGYLAYDLGRRLEAIPAIAEIDQDLPLLRLALHDWALAWDRRTGEAWLGGRALDGDEVRLAARLDEVRTRVALQLTAARSSGAPLVGEEREDVPIPPAMRSGTSRAAWLAGVQAVRAAIAAGELYQANLTRRLEAPFRGDPWPLFRRLRTGDPALFAAYLDLGPAPAGAHSRALLSASPEPFLAVTSGGLVSTDPIKGTRPRGRTREQDRALAGELLASAKDRAENVMIVDVLRNDLGRVCRPGTVRVPRLCRLERTAAVQHLVSTITGELAPGRDPFDLLSAAFPGGSITGAPKIRAMELVETLEPVRRGPYTGTLCWIGPDGAMGSSILIRTFVADGERLTLHVGGGITWRSDPTEEWDETVAKARGPLSAIGAVELEWPQGADEPVHLDRPVGPDGHAEPAGTMEPRERPVTPEAPIDPDGTVERVERPVANEARRKVDRHGAVRGRVADA
jgi:para-aminobenzoate synthetase component 1